MEKHVIRSIRKGTTQWSEEDRLALISILIKAGYTARIGYQPVPGQKSSGGKPKMEYTVECWKEQTMDNFPHILGQKAQIFYGGGWINGRIVNGHRFMDGIVTVETDDGQRIWCGEDRTDPYRPMEDK